MRSAQQMKTFMAAIFQYALSCFFSFYTRNLFIHSLGVAYLGVTGLMTNMLGMLALAELGVGSSIVFSLYKPLAENNQQKVHQLIHLFRRLYAYIGAFILAAGLLLMPFLEWLAPELKDIPHYGVIYLMYLASSVVPYYFAYNSTLYSASQQEYKLQGIRTAFYILTMLATILVLKLWPDYILLTACTMLLGVVSQIVIYLMAHRRWPWLGNKPQGTLTREELGVIKKNVRAMVLHKIGDYSVNGTANIIIANAVSLAAVGLMANYVLLTSILRSIIQSFFHAMIAGTGELVAVADEKKVHAVFEEMNFLAFWFFGLAMAGFYFCADAVIVVWLGEGFSLTTWAVLFLALDIFVAGMRVPPHIIKSGAGMFANDQYAPLFQAALNLGIGIFLAQYYGVAGVTFAMMFCGLCVPSWFRPYVIYRDYFHMPFRSYCMAYASYAAVLAVVFAVLFGIFDCYAPADPFLLLGYRVAVVLLVFHLFLFAFAPFLRGGRAAMSRGLHFIHHIRENIWKQG